MTKARSLAGLVAGVLILLSAAAHSLLGGRQIAAELVAAGASAELVQGVVAGWHFGGVAMLAFGCIVIVLFARRLRDPGASAWPALVIGVAYLLFGGVTILLTGELFFLVFVVPGLLLVIAALPPRRIPAG